MNFVLTIGNIFLIDCTQMHKCKQEAAIKKMKIQQNVNLYQQKVKYYEWKNEALKMTLQDQVIFLKRIENCVVCQYYQLFPIQYYLHTV